MCIIFIHIVCYWQRGYRSYSVPMIFLTAFITDSMSRLADSFYLDDMMRDIVRSFSFWCWKDWLGSSSIYRAAFCLFEWISFQLNLCYKFGESFKAMYDDGSLIFKYSSSLYSNQDFSLYTNRKSSSLNVHPKGQVSRASSNT